MPVSLTQSFSFSSQADHLPSSSQLTQNSTSDAKKAVRRVTIRQLWNAVAMNEEHFQFELNGIGIKQVVLVANILLQGATPSGRDWYILDDGTGRMKAYVAGRQKDSTYSYESFAYVRVVGNLELNYERRSISLLNMAPVHDPHEIYFQILHSIVDTVTHERGPPPWGSAVHAHSEPQVESLSQALQDVSISDEREAPLNSHSSLPSHHNNKRIRVRSKLERDIVIFISENIGGGSVPLEDIVVHIRTRHPDITSADAWNAIDYLLNENLIDTVNGDQDFYQPGGRLTGTF